MVREIIPSISSAEYFKLYNKQPFESINNENTKLNTNDNEEIKKLEFELAKEVHALILEQQLLSATGYYSWIDKDDYASFAWKMHRLINEDKLKENHLSTDNANKIKQFFFNNGFILGWTKEEQSAIQESRDYSLRSALLSLEEIAQAKIELQKYYESVYVNGDGSKREIKPFKEILRDINNFEKAYKERYNELVSLNEAIIQAKEGSNGQQNFSTNNNNTIKNTIETNTSIGNNIIQNNDNNNPNLSIADLGLEQQNLGEQNGKERTNRTDEPNRTRAGIPQEIHRRSEHGGQQEGVERSSDEKLLHQDPSLFIEPREQGGTRGVYRSSDQQAVSEESHRERDRLHEHVSRGDGISAKAEARADSNGVSSQASRMENGARSEEKGKRVIEVFENAYQFIIDLTYTKQMEEVLDEIVENKSSYLDFLQNLATKCPKIEKLERNDDEIKPSSEGQITYIENILRDLQLDLSEEFKNYKEDNRIAKAFLDRYIKEHEFFKKNNKKASSSNNNEIRPATPKQINFAEILAKKHNVKLPKDYKSNIKVCGDFINEYSKK